MRTIFQRLTNPFAFYETVFHSEWHRENGIKMVAAIREYHILGKPVPVDRLELGTVVNNVRELQRLNAGKEARITQIRLYCIHEENFEATRDDGLKGDAGIELRALGGPGGEAKVDGERGDTDKYKFQFLDTLEFEAEDADYQEAVKATGVASFLEKSSYSAVYMITGLKFGRKSANEFNKVREMGGGLGFDTNLGAILSVNPSAHLSKGVNTNQKSDGLTDRIFAIRVRKLYYKKKYGIFGSKKLMDEAHEDGAEVVGENKPKRPEDDTNDIEFEVQEGELDEEDMEGYEKITETKSNGETVTWIVSEDWE